MNLNNKLYYYLFLLFSLLSSCQEPISDIASVYRYINDPDNGLVAQKEVNGYILKAQFIPSELLTYREYKENNQINWDSVNVNFKNQITILLSIDTKDGFDVMTSNIPDYQAFKGRVFEMNFENEKYAKLLLGQNEYFPKINSLEPVYEAKGGREIIFVYAPDSVNDKIFFDSKNISFEYDDRQFNTGVNKFTFSRSDIDQFTDLNIKHIVLAK